MHAVIFVVDSADKNRMRETIQEFEFCTAHQGLKGKPLLIFANKQDLPASQSESEIAVHLKLDKLDTCSHNIMKCIAKPSCNGGVIDKQIMVGLEWIIATLNRNYSDVDKAVKSAIEERKNQPKRSFILSNRTQASQ